MKAKIILKLSLLLTVLSISVCSLTGCFWLWGLLASPEEYDEFDFEVVGKTAMSYVFDEESGYYDVYIEGTAKNPSRTDVSYGFITVTVYDSAGNVICTASDYIDYIEARSTWRFCAVGSSRYEPSSFSISELSGW